MSHIYLKYVNQIKYIYIKIFYRKRGPFLSQVKPNSMNYWVNDEPRALLRAMSMTVCDLSAITKPWEIEKRVADLVSSEFFEQGDMERQELNITPIVSILKILNTFFFNKFFFLKDLMNREKEDQLPMMQVGFIDSICLPIYEVIYLKKRKISKDSNQKTFYLILSWSLQFIFFLLFSFRPFQHFPIH